MVSHRRLAFSDLAGLAAGAEALDVRFLAPLHWLKENLGGAEIALDENDPSEIGVALPKIGIRGKTCDPADSFARCMFFSMS
jgi:hypothetical protein